MGRVDEHVVDVSVRPPLEDLGSSQDRCDEEASRDPVDFGNEAKAVPSPNVPAHEATPLRLPSARQSMLRAAKINVEFREFLPHSRERIEVRNTSGPNAWIS